MRTLVLLALLTAPISAEPPAPKTAKAPPIPVPKPLAELTTKSIPVTLHGQPFTTYIWSGLPKPVLYPIIGPSNLPMTRNWPLVPGTEAEEKDHPHHQSFWFAHGDINGIDFWTVGPKAGTIRVNAAPTVTSTDDLTTISSAETWHAPDGATILTSATLMKFRGDATQRTIDYQITLTASETELTFGDTKEGTMALRVRPELNLPIKKGTATITNNTGLTGEAVWGQPAAWVDYSTTIQGHSVGITCFDHPSNLRHPTTWHARDYGLFAANPFGLHDFNKAPAGTGNHVLAKGSSLTFHYLWLFHTGDAAVAHLPAQFSAWAEKK